MRILSARRCEDANCSGHDSFTIDTYFTFLSGDRVMCHDPNDGSSHHTNTLERIAAVD
jgi:hypothetical protein